MKSISEIQWHKDRPWLVVGKGPSFSKIHDIDLSQYYVFGLNHVINKIFCNVAHFIDLEVISKLQTTDCTALIVPWHPHVNSRPQERTLEEWIEHNEYLDFFETENRLYTYNLSTYKRRNIATNYPDITTKFFSAEAAFAILIQNGIKEIHSLGIDGGTDYAKEFSDLQPLTNGRKSFDDQFREINKVISNNNIEYKAL